MYKISRHLLVWLAGLSFIKPGQASTNINHHPEVKTGITANQDIVVEGQGKDFLIPQDNPDLPEVDALEEGTVDIIEENLIPTPKVTPPPPPPPLGGS